MAGRTPQGVRGLKSADHGGAGRDHTGRTPQGVHGLKSIAPLANNCGIWSHPARGAWIEISLLLAELLDRLSRTPQGVRGLKYVVSDYPSKKGAKARS